jgi:hypothetical protein
MCTEKATSGLFFLDDTHSAMEGNDASSGRHLIWRWNGITLLVLPRLEVRDRKRGNMAEVAEKATKLKA